MRISQLGSTTGISVATLKFYLREGLLAAGALTSANQASYDDSHVARARLIRALIEVGDLSVSTAKAVLDAFDNPALELGQVFEVTQRAVSNAGLYDRVEPASQGLARVDQVVNEYGWNVSDGNPGRHGAARVLDTYERIGHPALAVIPPGYARGAESIAEADLAAVAAMGSVADMSEVVVVGTVLGDALVASLRRMAQEHVTAGTFPVGGMTRESRRPRPAESCGS